MATAPILSKDGLSLYHTRDVPRGTLVVQGFWNSSRSNYTDERALQNAAKELRTRMRLAEQLVYPLGSSFVIIDELGGRVVVRDVDWKPSAWLVHATPLCSKGGLSLWRRGDLPLDVPFITTYLPIPDSALKTHEACLDEMLGAVAQGRGRNPGPLGPIDKFGGELRVVTFDSDVLPGPMPVAIVRPADDHVVTNLCNEMTAVMRINDDPAIRITPSGGRRVVTEAQRLAWSKRLRELQDAARHRERYAVVCEPIWLDD